MKRPSKYAWLVEQKFKGHWFPCSGICVVERKKNRSHLRLTLKTFRKISPCDKFRPAKYVRADEVKKRKPLPKRFREEVEGIISELRLEKYGHLADVMRELLRRAGG